MAVAAHAWATARGADELAMMAIEVKLRAERKAGQFIAEMKEQNLLSKGGGDQKSDHRLQDVSGDKPTLRELGVEKIESHRWQRLAQILEERFEELINNLKTRTQAAVLQAAAEIMAITASPSIGRKLDQACKEERRPRSNCVKNVLRKHFRVLDEKRMRSGLHR